MHWCLCNRSSIKILTSKSYEVITPGYINVDGTALYTCILYMYICISSVKIYLLGPVLHVFWPNVLPKLFQVKLHASARQSNLLQPRKQLQFFVWLLWIFSFVGSFKTVIVISKLELWPKLLWSLYSLSIPFFLPTISSLFFLYLRKKKTELDWEAIHWWPSGASHPNARPAVPSHKERWDSAVISMVLSNQKHSKKKHFQILFSLISWCQWCHSFLSLPLAMAKKLSPYTHSWHLPHLRTQCISQKLSLVLDAYWHVTFHVHKVKMWFKQTWLLLEQFAGAS